MGWDKQFIVTLDQLYNNPITKAKANKLIEEHKKNNNKDILILPDNHKLLYNKTQGYVLIKRSSDSGIIYSPYIPYITTNTSYFNIQTNSKYSK